MAKQPLKKGAGIKATSPAEKLAALKNFKEKTKVVPVKEKELTWYVLPEAFANATRLPGIPLGYVSAIRGHSNTGKSTIKLELIKAVQRQGDIPVVFELENNFAWTHAKDMGVEINEYVDEETGELCYGPSDQMLYFDTATLYEMYGCFDHEEGKMKSKPTRETYVIEDVAKCIRDLIKAQREGELPFNLVFIIDSIGVGDCYKSASRGTSNNMWYANALSTAFNTITNDLIPSSRNVNSEYTNTMFVVNKIWNSQTPTGLAQMNNKGGISMGYSYRILLTVGNVGSAGAKALTATSGGKEYRYGVKTKIKVEKNHVNNLTYEGEICSLQHGLWNPDNLDAYKKEYAGFIKQKLAETLQQPVETMADLEFSEDDINEG